MIIPVCRVAMLAYTLAFRIPSPSGLNMVIADGIQKWCVWFQLQAGNGGCHSTRTPNCPHEADAPMA